MGIDIDQALQNWARWVRDRHHQGHCISIEHRFRRRSREDDTYTGWGDWGTSPPIVPGDPIDALQALAVERVMRWVPMTHRKAIKLHYVYRLKPRWICARLVIPYKRWYDFLSNAQAMVANLLRAKSHVLTMGKKPDSIQPTIRLPAAAEIPEPIGSGCYEEEIT